MTSDARGFNDLDLLTDEDKIKVAKLAKIADYPAEILSAMLGLLRDASRGAEILRRVPPRVFEALEIVDNMKKDTLIAEVVVDHIQTSYAVTLALRSSNECRERIVDHKVSSYIRSLDEELEKLHKSLEKLSKEFHFKPPKKAYNELHEALERQRGILGTLISGLTYGDTICELPVKREDLKKYVGEKVDLQRQSRQHSESQAVNSSGSETLSNTGSESDPDTGYITPTESTENVNEGKVTGDVTQGCLTEHISNDYQFPGNSRNSSSTWSRPSKQHRSSSNRNKGEVT
ncbi:hypothetical protein MD484_g5488, partial [Candolleomyces efflorescens]